MPGRAHSEQPGSSEAGGERLPGEIQSRREVFAKDRAESAVRTKAQSQARAWYTKWLSMSTWLKFLWHGIHSLILKRSLVPSQLGQMGDSRAGS